MYLHSLKGNRQEASTIQSTVEQEFDLCCFDYVGVGQSEGTFLTFGFRESIDLSFLLKRLKDQFKYRSFVLWGRNVGANAIVQYLKRFKPANDIEAVVLDSLFGNTKEFVMYIESDAFTSIS